MPRAIGYCCIKIALRRWAHPETGDLSMLGPVAGTPITPIPVLWARHLANHQAVIARDNPVSIAAMGAAPRLP